MSDTELSEEDDDSQSRRDDERSVADSTLPGQWSLTEEDVRREKDESLARTETARGHVRTQESVMHRINAKLMEHGEYDAMAVAAGLAGLRSSSPSFQRNSSIWPVVPAEGLGSAEQRHSARVVAEEMLRRKERFIKFGLKRREVLEETRRSQVRLAQELEAAESRAAQRQRERSDANQRRAFSAQQRRNEQQKVFRENQREQERMWEAYYMARNSSKSPRGSPSRRQSTSSGPRLKSSTGSEVSGALEEDIYKSTLQSHLNYNDTIERWRQFERENERRTEAHKRKLLMGYGYGRSSLEEEAERPKGEKARVRKADSVKTRLRRRGSGEVVSGLAATTSGGFATSVSDAKPAEAETLKPADSFATLKLSTWSDGSFPKVPLKTSKSSPSLATWEQRREMCLRRTADLFEQNELRAQKEQESIQEARSRASVISKERMEKASELNQTWKERTDNATQRRAEAVQKSDEDLVQRMDEHTRRREEGMRHQAEERVEAAQAKSHRAREILASARVLAEEVAEKTQQQRLKKDELSQSNILNKLQEYEEKAHRGEYSEIARHKYELKQTQNEEYRRKVFERMQQKQDRSQNVLTRKNQPQLERLRAQRKEKSPPGKDRGHSTLSSTLAATLNIPVSAVEGLLAPPPSMEQVHPNSGEGGAARPEHVRGSSKALLDVLSSELQQVMEVESESALRQHVLDADEESAFLQELESRSVKWLNELRHKKAAWKP